MVGFAPESKLRLAACVSAWRVRLARKRIKYKPEKYYDESVRCAHLCTYTHGRSIKFSGTFRTEPDSNEVSVCNAF